MHMHAVPFVWCCIWANERLVMVPKKVLFCRLYLAATSGVCLIRSGAAGFQKKLHSHKGPPFIRCAFRRC